MFTLGPEQCLWAVLTWVDTVSLLQGHHLGEMLTSEAGKPRLRGCHKGVERLSMLASVIRFGPAGKMGWNMDTPCGINWESLITGSSRHPWTQPRAFPQQHPARHSAAHPPLHGAVGDGSEPTQPACAWGLTVLLTDPLQVRHLTNVPLPVGHDLPFTPG